jgi:DNA-binding Xre family transcriptional regulator
MEMRLRIPELLQARGLTAHAVAKRSKGRIDSSTLYRIVRARGAMEYFHGPLMEALCDVLDVAPGDLLERDATAERPPAKARGRK